MSDDGVKQLIEDALNNKALRTRFSQDRSATEMVESAAKEGYALSERDARKVLAGAYLTSDDVSSDQQNQLVGGLSWNFLQKVEDKLDGDFSLLSESSAWRRSLDFYEYVYERPDDAEA